MPPSLKRFADENTLALLHAMAARYATVQDYSAIFLKRERINDTLLPLETIELKFAKPLKVYMKWLGGPGKGARGSVR